MLFLASLYSQTIYNPRVEAYRFRSRHQACLKQGTGADCYHQQSIDERPLRPRDWGTVRPASRKRSRLKGPRQGSAKARGPTRHLRQIILLQASPGHGAEIIVIHREHQAWYGGGLNRWCCSRHVIIVSRVVQAFVHYLYSRVTCSGTTIAAKTSVSQRTSAMHRDVIPPACFDAV